MTDTPDPDQTRDIGLPPPARPTQQIRIPSSAEPTRQVESPALEYGTYPPNSQPRGRSGRDVPWWQTVNREHRSRGPTPFTLHPRPTQPRSNSVPPPAAGVPRAAPRAASRRLSSRRSQYALAVGLALATALVAGVAIGTFVGSRNKSSNKVLDIGKAQQGVAQVLVDPINGYGLNALGSVSCNGGMNPIVQQGNSFNCDVMVDQKQEQVLVVFQDDQGTYAVDRPR